MPRIGPLKGVCSVVDSAFRESALLKNVANYMPTRKRNIASLARDGTIQDFARLQDLERRRLDSIRGRTSDFIRSARFHLSPLDIDAWRANWRPGLTEDGKRVFDRSAAPALLDTQLGIQKYSGEMSKNHVLSRRGRKSKAPSWVLTASFNYSPLNEWRQVIAMPTRTAAEIRARTTAARQVMKNMDAGVNELNKLDVASFGFREYREMRAQVVQGVEDMTESQVQVAVDAYKKMIELYEPSRKAAIDTYRKSFPQTNMTDDEILLEQGFGPTLMSYVTHAFERSHRSGYGDYLMELASGTGLFNHSMLTPHTTRNNVALTDLIRLIGGPVQTVRAQGTLKEVYKVPLEFSGRTALTPDEAMRTFFPGITDDASRRFHISQIRKLAQAGDDSGVWLAMNPRFKNQFMLDRHGQQGFITDFWTIFDAYTTAANRVIHLDPLFAPNGQVNTFVNDLARVDRPASVDISNHFRKLIGLGPANDAAMQELAAYSHVIAGNVYAAISRMNPGLSLPNVLSPIMYGIPEALRAGFVKGGRDLFASLAMVRDPQFRKILKATDIADTYTFVSEAGMDVAPRSWAAWDAGDLKGAARLWKEFAVTYSDFLSLTESKLVRPLGAALGAARYARENNLLGVPLDAISPEHRQGIMREMTRVVSKSTILAATSNAVPLIREIRRIPVVGPMASMFTSTPVNIAAFMTTNLRTMVMGPPELRGEAFRVFSGQVTMGTLVAGPFWFFPWLREMESDEDKEMLIGALNAWERRFSLAGWLGTDLSRRLSPVTGITERFLDTRAGVPGLVLGPAGGPVQDIIQAAFEGDSTAKRRAAGALAPFLFDLPPSGVLPSAVQTFLPAGGIGIEKILRIALSTHSDPKGYISMGPLGLPVKNPAGYKVDALGRPYATTSPGKEFRRYVYGGRDILDAVDAAEGVRAKKRTEARQDVEAQIRRAIIEERPEDALRLFTENQELVPVITATEVERERLMRILPPKARAIYAGQLVDIVPRVQESIERIRAGGLSPEQEKEERMIALVGVLKLSNARGPRDVILGP